MAHRLARLLIGGCLAVSLGGGAAAQDGPAPEDATIAKLHARTMKFLSDVSTGDVPAAYAELLKESQLLKQAEAVKALIEKTNDLETKYGRYRGHERFSTDRLGADLVLLKYLYKCDDYPVVWRFIYYRDFRRDQTASEGGAWILVGVRFDSDLEQIDR